MRWSGYPHEFQSPVERVYNAAIYPSPTIV
jgi:hypothetical protein